VPAEGQFKRFSGSADFDPANPVQTRTRFDIDVAGFDLGDSDYNAELAKKDWFDTARYPKATFVSQTVKSSGPGKLDVSGKLTIKGRSADLSFPVTYRQEGQGYVFAGAMPIKRLAFAVGEGEWKDTGMLEDVGQDRVQAHPCAAQITRFIHFHRPMKTLSRLETGCCLRAGHRRRDRDCSAGQVQDRPEPHLPELRSRSQGRNVDLARQVQQDERQRAARPRSQDRNSRRHHRHGLDRFRACDQLNTHAKSAAIFDTAQFPVAVYKGTIVFTATPLPPSTAR
jgi:polyisoprenoid-binding protein YceI